MATGISTLHTAPAATAAAPSRERERRGRRRLLAADALTAIVWLSVAAAVALWLASGGATDVSDAASAVTAGGVVTGLVGTDLLLVMLVLAARLPFIDRVVGQDAAMALHRRLGKPALYLIIAHAVLLTAGYAMADGSSVFGETWSLLLTQDMPLAYLALALLVAVVITSIIAVVRRFSYEAWHLIHLLSYAAVLFAVPHQLSAGGVLAEGTFQRAYWIGLYVLAFGGIVTFRFGLPIARSIRHGIRVDRVEQIAPGVVSIHLTGRGLDRLGVTGGQYAIWRFWSRATWWHAHPVSFSAVPDATSARITVRDLGSGSAAISAVRVGTRVWFEGPYGVFTDRHRSTRRLVAIAAGIGITPIRSLVESAPLTAGEATVVLRSTDPSHTYLWEEIAALPQMRGNTIVPMVGHRPPRISTWMSAEALMEGVTLADLAPDIAASDVYVCGPQKWVDLVVRDAKAAGVPDRQIHVERFDW